MQNTSPLLAWWCLYFHPCVKFISQHIVEDRAHACLNWEDGSKAVSFDVTYILTCPRYQELDISSFTNVTRDQDFKKNHSQQWFVVMCWKSLCCCDWVIRLAYVLSTRLSILQACGWMSLHCSEDQCVNVSTWIALYYWQLVSLAKTNVLSIQHGIWQRPFTGLRLRLHKASV